MKQDCICQRFRCRCKPFTCAIGEAEGRIIRGPQLGEAFVLFLGKFSTPDNVSSMAIVLPELTSMEINALNAVVRSAIGRGGKIELLEYKRP